MVVTLARVVWRWELLVVVTMFLWCQGFTAATPYCPAASSVDSSTATAVNSAYTVKKCVNTDILLTGTAPSVSITHDPTQCTTSGPPVPLGGVTIGIYGMAKLTSVIITGVVFDRIMVVNSTIATVDSSVPACGGYNALHLVSVVPATPSSAIELLLSSVTVVRALTTRTCASTLNARVFGIVLSQLPNRTRTAIRVCSSRLALAWTDTAYAPADAGALDVTPAYLVSNLTVFNSSIVSPTSFPSNPSIRVICGLPSFNATYTFVQSGLGVTRIMCAFINTSFLMQSVSTSALEVTSFVGSNVALVNVGNPTALTIGALNSSTTIIDGLSASVLTIGAMYNASSSMTVFQRWTVQVFAWSGDFVDDVIDLGPRVATINIAQKLTITVLGSPKPKTLFLANLRQMSGIGTGITVAGLVARRVILSNFTVWTTLGGCTLGSSPIQFTAFSAAQGATLDFVNLTLVAEQTAPGTQSCTSPTMGGVSFTSASTSVYPEDVAFNFINCKMSILYPYSSPVTMNTLSSWVVLPVLGARWTVAMNNVQMIYTGSTPPLSWSKKGPTTTTGFVSLINTTTMSKVSVTLGNASRFEMCDSTIKGGLIISAKNGSQIVISRSSLTIPSSASQSLSLVSDCVVSVALIASSLAQGFSWTTPCFPDGLAIDGNSSIATGLTISACFSKAEADAWSLTNYVSTIALKKAVVVSLTHTCTASADVIVRDVAVAGVSFTKFVVDRITVYNVTVVNDAWSSCSPLRAFTFEAVTVSAEGVISVTNCTTSITRATTLSNCGVSQINANVVYLTPTLFLGRLVLCNVQGAVAWKDSNFAIGICGMVHWVSAVSASSATNAAVDVIASNLTGPNLLSPSTVYSVYVQVPSGDIAFNLTVTDSTLSHPMCINAVPASITLINSAMPTAVSIVRSGTLVTRFQTNFSVPLTTLYQSVQLQSRPLGWPSTCSDLPLDDSERVLNGSWTCLGPQYPLWGYGVPVAPVEYETEAPPRRDTTTTVVLARRTATLAVFRRSRTPETRSPKRSASVVVRVPPTSGPPRPSTRAPATPNRTQSAPHHSGPSRTPTFSTSLPRADATLSPNRNSTQAKPAAAAPGAPAVVISIASVSAAVVSLLVPSAASGPSRVAAVTKLPYCRYSPDLTPSYQAYPLQVTLADSTTDTALLVGSVVLNGALSVALVALVAIVAKVL